MPNITQLTTTSSIISTTTFVVINNGATRRYSYQDLRSKLTSDGAVGYTGSASVGYTGSTGTQGYTGYTGSTGTVGYTGSAGTSTGGTYTLTTATASVLGGVKIGSGVSITGDGTISASAGGGYSRTTHVAMTGSLYPGTTGTTYFTGFKSYALLKISTSIDAWVRLYTTSAARTSDSSRAQTTDPTPGSGVIAEVITSGAQTVLMTPGVIGFNDDTTTTSTIYAAVTNLSAGQQAVTVTLTLLQLEA